MTDEKKGGIHFDYAFGSGQKAGRAEERQRRVPFRALVMADFGGRRRGAMDRPRRVDRDTLAEAMSDAGVAVTVRVPNRLGSRPAQLDVSLSFSELRDFGPARLIEQVPALARARAVRDLLSSGRDDPAAKESLARALSEAAELDLLVAAAQGAAPAAGSARPTPGATPDPRPAPGATPPPRPAPAADADGEGDDLDRLLGMVDVPGPSTPAPEPERAPPSAAQAAVGSFISSITGTNRKRPAGKSAGPVGAVERLIADQLEAICGDPEVRALERAWSGLRFLVGRTDFRGEPVQIEILDVAKADVARVFRDTVYPAEAADTQEAPLGLVAAAYEFEKSAADLDALQSLAEDAEALQAPVVGAVGLGFLGIADGPDGPAELAALRDPGTRLDGDGNDQWSALRDKEAARWLALGLNPFLLRPAHDLAADRHLRYAAGGGPCGEPLWGEPCWVIASVVLRSFAEHGWPTEITGSEAGKVEDLPVLPFEAPGVQTAEIPLAAPLAQRAAESLSDAGLVPLACHPNRDAAFVYYARVVRRPGRIPGDDRGKLARLFTSLPYNLLAARVAQVMIRAKPTLATGYDDAEIGQRATRFLRDLLADTGPGASAGARVEPDPDEPSRRLLALSVGTGRGVLGGVDLSLDLPL